MDCGEEGAEHHVTMRWTIQYCPRFMPPCNTYTKGQCVPHHQDVPLRQREAGVSRRETCLLFGGLVFEDLSICDVS
jgi:hypothetical protein